ncbi:hypothetical protein C4E22_01775 [ANME-1 cluster archaeon AG-394-G06]|nr:hypothetical protein [ANME-1 cluster archaeon AG-394-G06]
MDEDWDNLILLDACRYDYFANMISDYFSGDLEKRVSIGSCTPEWCQKSFQSYYPDVIYVSGNPYINSKVKVAEFDAKKHFYKVADVWAFGWDEKLGTVPPHEINDSTLSLIEKYSEKRFIIHYLQPHAPYISQEFFVKGFSNPFTKGPLSGVQGDQTNRTVERVVNILGALLVKTNIIKNTWELREMLKLPPASPMDAVRRKYGVEGLREAYKENLGIALGYVAELSRKILHDRPSSRIVITADHGELLGEDRRYSHPHGSREPILVEVPWFKIKSVKSASNTAEIVKKFGLPMVDAERERAKDVIRKLKKSGKL